jgi:CHAT domain-containing protein
VRAERKDDPRDLISALECAHRAVDRQPGLVVARFNLALARDKLGLRNMAAVAWRSYLDVDGRSGWAREARQQLAALAAATAKERWPMDRERLRTAGSRGDPKVVLEVVRKFPQASRLLVEEEVLPAWGSLHAAGREQEAQSTLKLARIIAQSLAVNHGDLLLAETVAGIDDAGGGARKSARLELLASGLRKYGQGVATYQKNGMRQAAEFFKAAARKLRLGASPFAVSADLYLAILSYQRDDYGVALERLRRIAADSLHRSHSSLLGRAHWVEGLSDLASAHPIEATAAYRLSLAEFEASGEVESAVAVHGMLATTLHMVGDQHQSWRHRLAALAGVPQLLSLRRQHVIFGATALAAKGLGESAAARDFQDESVSWARLSANALDIAEELRARAAISVEIGEVEPALADLAEARVLTSRLEPPLRKQALAEIETVEARALQRRDPGRALLQALAAVALFRETGFTARLASAYLDLALAQLAVGSDAAAAASLSSGIAAEEEEWRHLVAHLDERQKGDLWSGYSEQRHELFDEQVSLLARQNQVAPSFDSSERSRSWDLLLQLLDMPELPPRIARMIDPHRRPLQLAEVERRLPPNTVILDYRLLRDRALCWVIRHDGTRLHVLARPPIDELVVRLRAYMEKKLRQPELLEVLGALYSTLVAPIRRELDHADELVVVPDRALYAVPFAGLRDTAQSRFLIEDFAVAIAPSAEIYLNALDRDRHLAGDPAPSALVVCDPAFRRDLFPNLAPLPSADEECRAVTSLYSRSESITGSAATRGSVLAALGRHAVVHLAGHTVTSVGEPWASAMPLAPVKTDSGVLYAFELLGRPLQSTRLVVLASCATAGDAAGGSGRVSGFVQPLLFDGVPAVIGTLWAVEDSATADFFKVFHSRFLAGDDAIHALRAAQLSLLAKGTNLRPGSPEVWANFELFGGTIRPSLSPSKRVPREGKAACSRGHRGW